MNIDKIIETLKESKVTSKKWKGKWCYWFKEEFEEYPEAEMLLRKVLELGCRVDGKQEKAGAE